MSYIIFTMPKCSGCMEAKKVMRSKGIEFKEKRLDEMDAATLTDIRLMYPGISAGQLQAPILIDQESREVWLYSEVLDIVRGL